MVLFADILNQKDFCLNLIKICFTWTERPLQRISGIVSFFIRVRFNFTSYAIFRKQSEIFCSDIADERSES